MMKMKKILAGIMAFSLAISGMLTAMPMKAQAAAPTVSVSNTAVSVINGETTSITVSLQNYTKTDFDVDYTLSAPGFVTISKGNKDLINKTITLNITGVTSGATGVVVYLTNNLSSYATFTIVSKNKAETTTKTDDDNDDNETTKKVGDYRIKYDTYVYGDHDEKAKVKYVDIVDVDGTEMVTAYVKIKNDGHKNQDKYFKANFYDKNDKLISTKYIYEPELTENSYIFLWWEIPNNTKTVRFEQ